MATQYRQIIMDAIIEEYGFVGDYLPRLTLAMERIPDAVIEYCMSNTHHPDDDENMIHLLIDECPQNIVTMLIEVDEYDDHEIQRNSVRNMIALCLYILYIIAMNVPNHPHRMSNWQEMIQRYAKNGDIHTVISRVVNAHMNRYVDRVLTPIDETIEHTPIRTTPVEQLYDSGHHVESVRQINYTPEDDEDDDDEDANENLPEDVRALFGLDNFNQYIMEGVHY